MKSKFLFAIFLLTSLIGLVSADAGDCGMYNMMSGAYGMGFGIFGWIFSLLVLVALVLLIIWLTKQIQKK